MKITITTLFLQAYIFIANIATNAANIIPLDMKSGLESAKNEVTDIGKFLVNSVAVPVIGIFLGGILVFNVAKAYKKHQAHDPYSENIAGIAIVIVCLVLVISAPNWLWTMTGN